MWNKKTKIRIRTPYSISFSHCVTFLRIYLGLNTTPILKTYLCFVLSIWFKVAPLLFQLFFQTVTFYHAIKRRLYVDLATMIPMYVYHFALTYMVFGSMTWAIIYYSCFRVVDAGIFIWLSQVNHIVMDVHDDDKDESWVNLQVNNLFFVTLRFIKRVVLD